MREGRRQHSKTVKNSNNPVFNEEFFMVVDDFKHQHLSIKVRPLSSHTCYVTVLQNMLLVGCPQRLPYDQHGGKSHLSSRCQFLLPSHGRLFFFFLFPLCILHDCHV